MLINHSCKTCFFNAKLFMHVKEIEINMYAQLQKVSHGHMCVCYVAMFLHLHM